MQDDTGICLWKFSYLNGSTSFNGGHILPESQLNQCMTCEDYGLESLCSYRVPYTIDPEIMRSFIKKRNFKGLEVSPDENI